MASAEYTILTWQYFPPMQNDIGGLEITKVWSNFFNTHLRDSEDDYDDILTTTLAEHGAVYVGVDVTDGHYLKFANEADMTMFLLRYS